MKPREKVDLFYLLTPEALRKDELEAFYQRNLAIAGDNIAKLLLSESVLTKLRAEIKAESGYRLPLDELAEILFKCVLRTDVQSDGVDRQLKRVQRDAKAGPRRATAPDASADDATVTGV